MTTVVKKPVVVESLSVSELLNDLIEDALSVLGELTFLKSNVEGRASKNGNVGFRVETEQGKTITFWKSNMDLVVEAINEDTLRVIPGTQILENGSLIPRTAIAGDFWS